MTRSLSLAISILKGVAIGVATSDDVCDGALAASREISQAYDSHRGPETESVATENVPLNKH